MNNLYIKVQFICELKRKCLSSAFPLLGKQMAQSKWPCERKKKKNSTDQYPHHDSCIPINTKPSRATAKRKRASKYHFRKNSKQLKPIWKQTANRFNKKHVNKSQTNFTLTISACSYLKCKQQNKPPQTSCITYIPHREKYIKKKEKLLLLHKWVTLFLCLGICLDFFCGILVLVGFWFGVFNYRQKK